MKKLLKKIKLIKSDKYLFLLKEFKSDYKLNPDILKFNFKNELPYNNVYYVKHMGYLLIYNTDIKSKFFLPEGLVLFYGLKNDGVFYMKNPGGYYNVIVRKENNLLNDFTVNDIDAKMQNTFAFEYGLDIQEADYAKTLSDGYNNFNIKDLYYLWDISFDYKKLKPYYDRFPKPFFVASLLVFVLVFAYKYYLDLKQEKLQNRLSILKKETLIIENKYTQINNMDKRWQKIAKMLKKPQSFEILNQLVKIVKGNGRLSFFSVNKNYLIFTVDGSDSTPVLNALSKNKLFNNITLKSGVQIGKIKRFRFEGQLNE